MFFFILLLCNLFLELSMPYVPINKLAHFLLTFDFFVVDVPINKLAHFLLTFDFFVVDVPISKLAHFLLTFGLFFVVVVTLYELAHFHLH